MNQKNRGHFSSSIGFVLAAAGSAVGLGNLWKFPYVAGGSGGGLFIFFYIAFIFLLGVPLIVAEMAIGRAAGLNPVGSFKKLGGAQWSFVGAIGVICAMVVLSYYSVVGGWVIRYLLEYLKGGDFGKSSLEFFEGFTSSPVAPLIYHMIFLALTAIIVTSGIAGGIEKVSKVMLPGLLMLMIITAARSLTLPEAEKGLSFFFMPKWDVLSSPKEVGRILVLSMGQVFFSLSLGTGITITYGSYLKKDSDIGKSAVIIAIIDTAVAVLSGLIVLPAVFSLGITPAAGPGLLFETLPEVFSSIPLGKLFGLVFFILVLFAALTSSISMMETAVSFLIDRHGMPRWAAALLISLLLLITGSAASLSQGVLSGFKLLGMNLFDFFNFIGDKILMPLAGILTCIFLGYFYGIDNISEEISRGTSSGVFKMKKAFSFSMKYLAPLMIFAVFIMSLIS